LAKQKIPGLAIGIVRNGELAKAQGYGKSNLETDSGVSPQSVFDLASLTKPFAAEAVMMLAEDGKLHLK
jgi:CubicO group peptidase (beta-lactamase class C family)